MIVIHHLGRSQSDRVVWLMEELGLPYELKWYDRAGGLMPEAYKKLHPAATAPVIEDGKTVLTESAVILEYICHKYANGKLTVGPNEPNYTDYLYWMHFNNNVQGLFFAKLAAAGATNGAAFFIKQREDVFFKYLDARLGQSQYLVGPQFTCADIMVTFNLAELALFGGRTIEDLPNARAYVKRIEARPAYAKAMLIAGPNAPSRA